MIYVEQHMLDPNTMMPIGSLSKCFTSLSEFNAFYKIAKADPCVILNIMRYNPEEKSGQKSVYDAKLYSLSREIKT